MRPKTLLTSPNTFGPAGRPDRLSTGPSTWKRLHTRLAQAQSRRRSHSSARRFRCRRRRACTGRTRWSPPVLGPGARPKSPAPRTGPGPGWPARTSASRCSRNRAAMRFSTSATCWLRATTWAVVRSLRSVAASSPVHRSFKSSTWGRSWRISGSSLATRRDSSRRPFGPSAHRAVRMHHGRPRGRFPTKRSSRSSPLAAGAGAGRAAARSQGRLNGARRATGRAGLRADRGHGRAGRVALPGGRCLPGTERRSSDHRRREQGIPGGPEGPSRP